MRMKRKATSAHLRSDTLLQGRWLLAARLFWVILALAIVVLNVLSVPAVIASTFLTPEISGELHTLGLSQTLYLTLVVGMNGMCIICYLAMAALLFWRRSGDRMAFFGSLTLLTFGGVVDGFPSNVSGASLAWNLVIFVPFLLGQVSFLAFFFLFPSGRFVPRWTGWFTLLCVPYWFVMSFSRADCWPAGISGDSLPSHGGHRAGLPLSPGLDVQRASADQVGGLRLCPGDPVLYPLSLARLCPAANCAQFASRGEPAGWWQRLPGVDVDPHLSRHCYSARPAFRY